MINIQIKDKTFKVIWKYCFVEPFHKKDPLSTTFCYIIDKETKKEIAQGFACQSQKDLFDSDKARKVSLAHALLVLGTSKVDREQVWKQYLNRKNVPNIECKNSCKN